MANKPLRSPEEIEQMCLELQTMTQDRVGELHGRITGERVRQLVGNVNRHHPPTESGWQNHSAVRGEANRERVAELSGAGKSDEQIASATGLVVETVQKHRRRSGLRRNFKQTKEHDLWCLAKWVELFGYVPAATDWNPQDARKKGHERRAIRFEQFRARFHCPYFNSPQKHFGSWANFIERGGHPRPSRKPRRVPWREAPLLSELEEPVA